MVIQAVTGKSLWHLAWSWFATLFKLRQRELTVTEWRGRRMTLDARPRQKISIDGEIAAKTPVVVEVARGAIEVAAPRETSPLPSLQGRGRGWVSRVSGSLRSHPPLNPLPCREGRRRFNPTA